MTLADVLDAAAASLSDIERPDSSSDIVWVRAGQSFAVLARDGLSAEFLLDARVAAAAARTPDTTPSDRGPGWVRFTPTVLDPHAIDRATAWFVSAHRRFAGR